jgi:RNA polymerase sigma factor (sigma-70 family)
MPDIGISVPPRSGLQAVLVASRAKLARLVGRIVSRNDVDDLLTEAFMRSFEAGGKPFLRHSPRAFLLRAASNLGLSPAARAANRLNAQKEDLAVPEVYQLSIESPEVQLADSQRFVTFCRAVGSLPEDYRRAFVLKKVYGLSQQEIADRLGIPRSLVEKHIAIGLLLCREYMETASRPVPGSGGEPDTTTRKSGRRHSP